MRWIALLIFFSSSLVGCTPSEPADTSVADVRLFEATLKSLNLSNPDGDVKAHLARGDFRPIGLETNHSTCMLARGDGKISKFWPLGMRCLHVPQYISNDSDQFRLFDAAEKYSRAYNDALNKELNGHYVLRFSADGLTWTVPDRFTVSKDEDVSGKTKDWFVYGFWKDGKFGDCVRRTSCGAQVRILPGPGHYNSDGILSKISSSPRDGSDLNVKLVQTRLASQLFQELRYIGSASKFHYFVMKPLQIGHVTCWSDSDKYVAPVVEPGIEKREDLTCWAPMEMPNRTEVLIQVWGTDLIHAGEILTNIHSEVLALVQ
jgi:hypothetical protein